MIGAEDDLAWTLSARASAVADDIFSNRLLVVDDEPGIVRLIKRVAEGSGFDVAVTEDPRTFAKAVRSWRPRVIIMDLKMPGTDGIQLLRDLAADKCTAHVVLASGEDSKVLETAEQLGRERGLNMSGMLQKPIRIETLRELLAAFKPVPKTLLSTDLAEALVRWRHPRLGIIRPDQFIALAEETDLIHRLTDWVVAEAAKQAAVWHADNLALEVAVNISAEDIEDLDLPERLDQRCRDAGIDPASMILELTETGAMREAVQMMDVLTRLRLRGFKLSIDDFGTGYSSLVQLQKIPFSELKIDRSFVMQMLDNRGCKVIVEIVIDLARKLGMNSVAEGVEAEEVLHTLIEMDCDMAQGYYLSRPLAADDVSEFVRNHQGIRAKGAA